MNSYNKLLGASCLLLLLCTTAQAQLLDSTCSVKVNFGAIIDRGFISTADAPYAEGISLNLVKETAQGNSHEWGLSHLQLAMKGTGDLVRDSFGNRTRAKIFQGGLRYQYTWNFLPGAKPRKWEPFVGVGAFIGMTYESDLFGSTFNNGVITSSRRRNFFAGAELIPGLKWRVNKKFFVEFSLPIQYIPVTHTLTESSGPDGYSGSILNGFDYPDAWRLGARLGLGFRLGK